MSPLMLAIVMSHPPFDHELHENRADVSPAIGLSVVGVCQAYVAGT